MKYVSGKPIKVGDKVVVEGDVDGVVVCDFDSGTSLDGFSDWDSSVKLESGGNLSSGVLIQTEKLGLLHYPEEDEDIVFVGHV